MSGRRAGDRRIVIRSQGCISKAEIRQSILRYLLQEYDIQRHSVQEHKLKEHPIQKHPLQEHDTGVEMGRGRESDAGDRE